MIRGVPGGVWILRALVILGILLSLLAGVPAGYRPRVAFVVVVLLVALVAAFRPEDFVLPLAMGLVIVWWALHLRADLPAAVLVVAAAFVVVHVAATLLAYGPPSLAVDPRLAALWSVRGLLVWLAALVVWSVARAYSGHGTPTLYWLTGLAAALVGSVLAAASVPVRRGLERE